MGLAKFKEEINERYLDAVLPGLRPAAPPTPAPQPISGDVRALGLDGSPVEDFVVFTTDQKFEFTISTSVGASAARVALVQEPASMKLRHDEASGQYSVTCSKPGSARLLLTCGAYHKSHQVAFMQPIRPDSIPEVDTLLKSLDTNPVTWNATYGQTLHDRLSQILKKHELPQEFGDGVYEYHLGLVHEAEGDRRFVERLERAFALLEPFSRHSPYANLMCRYFLFRVNVFATAETKRGASLLDRASTFFSRPFRPCKRPSSSGAVVSTRARSGQLQILIALPDYHLLEAVRAYEQGDSDRASALLGKSRDSNTADDLQREARQTLLAARVARSTNDRQAALRHYTSLQFSVCDPFREESVEYCANFA